MSHSACVFTLWSHARKEISHGLLKVARWERIAAVPPALQRFTSQSQNLFHVISATKALDQQKTATLTVVKEKATVIAAKAKTSGSLWEMCVCVLIAPYW